MKKILFAGFLCVIALTVASCHKDLNIVQRGKLTSNEAWETQGDAISCTYGMMAQFRDAFKTNFFLWGEYRSGAWEFTANASAKRINIMNNQIQSSDEGTDWSALYKTLNTANVILKHAPDVSFTDKNLEKKVFGSAYFTRAFIYYWIVRIWGDAPLITAGLETYDLELLYPSRSSKSEIYKQIESDLESASQYLEGVPIEPNMPNILAVNTLKTDFNLWMYKVEGNQSALQKAKEACSSVIGKRSLVAKYENIFSVKNKLNDEEIFVWSMVKDECEGGYPQNLLTAINDVSAQLIENPVKSGSHTQLEIITQEYRDLLGAVPSDARKIATYDEFYDTGKDRLHRWINKFAGTWQNGARTFDSDIIAYRYADILLFDAEIKCAENKPEEALASVNAVAQRAYGTANYYQGGKTVPEVLDIILEERCKEFLGEGKLWWDFIRFGVVFNKVSTLSGKSSNKNILLWPVNQETLNANPNMTQTDIEY